MNCTEPITQQTAGCNSLVDANFGHSISTGEFRAAMAASLARIIPGAPVQNRPALYKMLARENAASLAVCRQDSLDSTWDIAASVDLPQAIGTSAVQQILADAFGGHPINVRPDTYECLTGTFADACRDADRQYRQQSKQPTVRKQPQLAESTRQAIDWLRKHRSDDDLRNFLRGRSKEQIQLIVQHLSRTKSS
jgi:hypothetical protein